MRKFLVLLLVLCAVSTSSFAQATFGKGVSVISVGAGIGSSYYGAGYAVAVPPVFASYEYGIIDNLFDGRGSIGVGGMVGYTSSKWKYNNNSSFNINYTTFAAQGNLHYEFVENLDTYAGITLGYYTVNHNIDDNTPWGGTSGSLAWGLNAGARYYFRPNFAVMAEAGYGMSNLSIGVSFRF